MVAVPKGMLASVSTSGLGIHITTIVSKSVNL